MWWRVYYTDGSVFTDKDGSPDDAPRSGVGVIVQERSHGDYELVHGKDYYYFEPVVGGWHSTDIFGAFDHLLRAKRQCLLFGRMMSDPEWGALFRRVKNEVGPRSATFMRENKREPRA